MAPQQNLLDMGNGVEATQAGRDNQGHGPVLRRQPDLLEDDEVREDMGENGRIDSRDPSTAKQTACSDCGSGRMKEDPSLISVVRELFFSAFSDNYQDTYVPGYCCGGNELISSTDESSVAKTPPRSKSALHPSRDLGTKNIGRNSSYVYGEALETSSSYEAARKLRNKPVAVATGYNFANDFDGRPIVITSNARRSPTNAPPSPPPVECKIRQANYWASSRQRAPDSLSSVPKNRNAGPYNGLSPQALVTTA